MGTCYTREKLNNSKNAVNDKIDYLKDKYAP
jgi:hypothetical protein